MHQPTRLASNAAVSSPSEPARTGALVVVLVGTFMASLDVFIVNVSLPSIAEGLHASSSALEWVAAGYSLPYGVALITGARMGDRFGRRQLFLWGVAGFTVASAACGLAPTAGVLIATRVIQGLSAAMLTPQVLSILTTAFPDPRARLRAIDAYAATIGIAGVLGQLIGGALVRWDIDGLGWRTCFLINVPVGIAVLLAGRRVLPTIPTHSVRMDPGGTALIGGSLVLLTLPLVEGRSQGWPAWTWVCLAAFPFVLFAFVAYERRQMVRGASPLIDLGLFRERAFNAGLVLQLLFWLGQGGFFFSLALYCQIGLGLSALRSGCLFLAIGAGYMASSSVARHVAARLGRQVLALGGGLALIGDLALLIGVHHSHVGHVWPLVIPLFVFGLGSGLVVGPLAGIIMTTVEPHHAGAASGALNTTLQIGSSTGVALLSVAFFHAAGAAGVPHSYELGFESVLPFMIGIAAAVAVLAQLLKLRPAGAA